MNPPDIYFFGGRSISDAIFKFESEDSPPVNEKKLIEYMSRVLTTPGLRVAVLIDVQNADRRDAIGLKTTAEDLGVTNVDFKKSFPKAMKFVSC
jgi:hypothetical protein